MEDEAQAIAQPIIDYYHEHNIIPDRSVYNRKDRDEHRACVVGVLVLMNGASDFFSYSDTGLELSQARAIERGFCGWGHRTTEDGELVEPVYYRAGQIVAEAVR